MDSASSWGPAPTTTPMPANMQGSSVTSRSRAGLHARWVYCDVGGLTLYDPLPLLDAFVEHTSRLACVGSQRGGSPPLFCCRVSIGRGCARYRALDSQKGRRPDGATTHESSLSVISAKEALNAGDLCDEYSNDQANEHTTQEIRISSFCGERISLDDAQSPVAHSKNVAPL